MEDFPSNTPASNKNMRPIAIVSQLLQVVAGMRHSDDLFAWLANIIVEQCGIASTQIWAVQAYRTEALRSQLRASASRHPSQAATIVESGEVKVLVERMLRDQRGVLSIPVINMFSHYQAGIFAQQECVYWTTYFLSRDILLPPPQKSVERGIATPLQMIFSFFTQQPLQQADARALSFLLDQSFRIATSQGLLAKPTLKEMEASQATFDTLIPERIEITEMEQGKNPFNSTIVIQERKTRQFYNLIDGKKTLSELTSLIGGGRKESLEMLRALSGKGYIRVRDAGGNIVDISSLS